MPNCFTKRPVPEETKAKAREMLRSGKSYAEVARALGISQWSCQQLYRMNTRQRRFG